MKPKIGKTAADIFAKTTPADPAPAATTPPRGRPPVHDAPWSKVTVVLFDRQTDYLDRLTLDIRQKARVKLTRAELIRAALDALQAADPKIGADGTLTLGTPLSRIDLKTTR